MVNDSEFGFGRIPSADARDGLYAMRSVLGPPQVRTGEKVWVNAFDSLNQGSEGTCVGHDWKHWLLTEPLVQAGPTQEPTALAIYDRATEIDEFPGNDGHNRAFGTSVRAGAEVLKQRGLIAEYRHAQRLQDVTDWLADKGPVVIGVNWYTGMARDFDGSLLRPTGPILGGHCVCVQGVDFDKGVVLIRNSWGKTWGPWQNGLGHIAFADLEKLLFAEGGDCIAGLEMPLGLAPALTFADALDAAKAAHAAMPAGARYSGAYYRKLGAEAVVTAIQQRGEHR